MYDRMCWRLPMGIRISHNFVLSPILPFVTRRVAMNYAFKEWVRGYDDRNYREYSNVAEIFYCEGWNRCREGMLDKIDKYKDEYVSRLGI